MNTATAYREHVRVKLTPVMAVLATVVVAATVLVLINRPAVTSTSTGTQAGVATAAQAAAVPLPETQALRRQVAEAHVAVVPPAEAFQYPRNHVQGTTLNPASVYELAPPASTYLPGSVADPHPLNHFAGQPR